MRERFYEDRDKGKTSWNEHKARYGFVRAYCLDKRVLDVGCGSGHGCYIFSKVAESVIGIDYSDAAIDYAKKHYPGINFIVMRAEELMFPNETFDIVVSLEVMEHVYANEAFLLHATRVLKRQGTAIFSVPIERELWHKRGRGYHRWGFTYGFLMNQLSKHFNYIYPLSQENRHFKELDNPPLGCTLFICRRENSESGFQNPWKLPSNPKQPFSTKDMYYPEEDRYEQF